MDVVDRDLALRILRYVLLARRFEERLIELFAAGHLKGWVHSGLAPWRPSRSTISRTGAAARA
jgi:hypothetical protein